MTGVLRPVVGHKIVNRDFGGLPLAQRLDVLDQKLALQSVRVIVVNGGSLLITQMRLISVVGVVFEDVGSALGECIGQLVGHRGFPASRSTGHTNDKTLKLRHFLILPRRSCGAGRRKSLPV